MATEQQVLEILLGQKVRSGNTWRVYDAGGAELADASGVLFKGVMGALLWGAMVNPFAPSVEPSSYYTVGKEAHMRQLREEDETLLAILQMFVMEEA